MTGRHRHPEQGFTAAEFSLSVGLLVLPVTLIVLSLPTWLEHRSFASTAAQEAARAAVLADTPQTATRAARLVVDQIATNTRMSTEDLSVCFAAHDVGQSPGGCTPAVRAVTRGDAITARLSVEMPALSFPLLGATFDAFTYSAAHTERVDDYRSFPSE